jgi:glycosyltransferase involved in cell wall biosynthesis
MLIVHEQGTILGGQERVLEALMRRYPAARGLALDFVGVERPAGQASLWDGRSQLVRQPGTRRPFRSPLYARRMAAADTGAAELVVSVAQGGWSVAARVPEGARHVVYSSGLPATLYRQSALYVADEPRLLRPLLPFALPGLRAHHRGLMRRPHRVVVNSEWSARDFEREHRRTSTVVYPPVRTDVFTPLDGPREHYLVAGRLVPQKRMDVVVEACRELDAPLVVAGDGAELGRLRALAGPRTRFVGFAGDDELRELYRSARALICPSLETFGLVMAEALACGTPVIAPRIGGALEIVRDGVNGVFMDAVDAPSVARAMRALEAEPPDAADCRTSAEPFSEASFLEAMERVLDEERALARTSAPAVARAPAGAGA